MAVRTTMAALIARVRQLINDPAGVNQQFSDQDIQDVMDESRRDLANIPLKPRPTFSGTNVQYLDYYADYGGWEDGAVLKQYLTLLVTPSTSEPIAGHWIFTQNVFPTVYITGSVHDVYRAAADLLERWAAKWALSYNINVDGQNLQRGQVTMALHNLARTYRAKQRPVVIAMTRSDLNSSSEMLSSGLGPTNLDYMASGDGR